MVGDLTTRVLRTQTRPRVGYLNHKFYDCCHVNPTQMVFVVNIQTTGHVVREFTHNLLPAEPCIYVSWQVGDRLLVKF